MIKAPNGDILIDKNITGIENLLELIVDATGLQRGDIRIDESTIREVSEKDRNTAVDVEITKGGHTNRVVAYYNRVSLAEIGNVEAEKNNDAVLNYIDGENGDFSTAFNDNAIKTKLKKTVGDRVNIPSDEIVVESIDYSKKYEGYTSVTFKTNGDNAKTIKDNFTVKSWYVPPIYTINDEDFRRKLGTPNDFSDRVFIEVKNDRDLLLDTSIHVANGRRKANNPLFFPKGNITDFESTNYSYGNSDDELVGYLVDAYHTGEIQDSVNNKYEITEVKQLENGFSKVWVENKNKDIIDRNGFYKIRQFDLNRHAQLVIFKNDLSDTVKYVHGVIRGSHYYKEFHSDDNKRYTIFYSTKEGYLIYPIEDLLNSLGLKYEGELIYLNPDPNERRTPPSDFKIPELTDDKRKELDRYFKIKKKYKSFDIQFYDVGSIGLFNLKYGQVFKFEKKEVDNNSYSESGSDAYKIHGTAKILQREYDYNRNDIINDENKTYYSHSNYGRIYRHEGNAVYFAKMTAGTSHSDEEIREEKELIKREIFNRYGLPYNKITIDWDKTLSSNFNKIYYNVKQAVSCKETSEKLIPVYKRIIPEFTGTPAISADIRYVNRQELKNTVSNEYPIKREARELPEDKNSVEEYYYFSGG